MQWNFLPSRVVYFFDLNIQNVSGFKLLTHLNTVKTKMADMRETSEVA